MVEEMDEAGPINCYGKNGCLILAGENAFLYVSDDSRGFLSIRSNHTMPFLGVGFMARIIFYLSSNFTRTAALQG